MQEIFFTGTGLLAKISAFVLLTKSGEEPFHLSCQEKLNTTMFREKCIINTGKVGGFR